MYKEYLIIFEGEKEIYWFNSHIEIKEYLKKNPHKEIESGKRVVIKEIWQDGWKLV